jgi:hypothetical protein
MSFNTPSHEELAQHYLIAPAPTEELPEDERQRLGAKRTSYRRKLDRQQHEVEAANVDFSHDADVFGVSPRMAPWLKAFNVVAVNYFEFRNASPMPVQDYGKMDEPAGPVNGELAQRPNARDFIADVECVSRRALHDVPALLRLFNVVILNEDGKRWHRVPLTVQQVIARCVGEAFVRNGLLPSKYFRVIRKRPVRKVR